MLKRLILTAAILCATAPSVSAAEDTPFFYILEAEALGGYSEIVGHDGTGSSIDKWLFSPTVKVNEDIFWISMYNGAFNRSAQVIAQEEGGRQTSTTMNHSLSTALKVNVNESVAIRPLVFADWVFINETEDEDFGEGLYDYRDIGGGVEASWITLKTDEVRNEARLGFRYIDRQYPNYQSLLSLFDPNGSLETNEKDLKGYKANLAYDSRSKDGWSWGVEGIFFYKDYTDKLTINSNGIRTGDNREDTVEYANVWASLPLAEQWLFRIEGQFSANQSNLDFYDTHNTLTLADDDFVEGYFDYFSGSAKPSLTYIHKMGDKMNLIVTGDYTFYALMYPERRIQDISGVYQNEEQEDFHHTFSLRASVPITQNFAWVIFGSYTDARSNQDFERFYLYTYESWTAVTGISFKS